MVIVVNGPRFLHYGAVWWLSGNHRVAISLNRGPRLKGHELPAANPASISAKSHARSRITNGSLLPGVDGRSTWARRLRDLIELHAADLGGEDAITAAEKSILRRAATLTVELERMELGFAQADGADADSLDLYSRTAGNLRRLLEAVGLQRRSRDVTPSLASYIEGKAS